MLTASETLQKLVILNEIEKQPRNEVVSFYETRNKFIPSLFADIPPALVEMFGSQVVKRGDAVSLLCRARGSPAPELTWAIDGDFLYPSHRLKIAAERGSLEVESLLNISEARNEDSGEYSCLARNDIATEAHFARLDVHGPPFVRPLRNVTVVSGTELTLRCPYGGYPIDSLTWQKGELILLLPWALPLVRI